METRTSPHVPQLEIRENGSRCLSGYAAVFYREDDPGTQFQLRSDAVERIFPGAFNRTIAAQSEVRATWDHRADALLGSTRSGTLRLSVDERGLRYEVDLPDTSAGRDVAELVRRGDVSGSSFGFVAREQRWQNLDGGKVARELRDLDLSEVGPVVTPAYAGTTVSMRGANDDASAEKSLEEFLAAQRRAISSEADAIAIRLRLISITG